MTDIDINLIEVRAVPTPEVTGTILRDLTPADIKLLAVRSGAPEGIPLRNVDRLSARHHALAKVLAAGYPNWQASAATGYAETTISQLKGNSAFQNLIKHYADKQDMAYVDTHERLADLTRDAAAELHQRLEEDPTKFSNGQLMEIIKLGADRTGHGPQAAVAHKHEHTINMADRMQAARKRATPQVIDVTPEKTDAA